MKKNFFIGFILIALIGAAFAYYLFNKPVESLNKTEEDFQIEAENLYLAFDANEEEANSKYLDKVITVNGKIKSIENNNNKISLYLDVDSEMSSIICELEDGQSIENLKEGVSVKVKGQCTGYLMDVVLVRSVIL